MRRTDRRLETPPVHQPVTNEIPAPATATAARGPMPATMPA